MDMNRRISMIAAALRSEAVGFVSWSILFLKLKLEGFRILYIFYRKKFFYFVSRASTSYCLAVLHPRRLSVYALSSTIGAVAHGSQYKLQHVYSHNLQRTSFNMCHGPFGQIKGKFGTGYVTFDRTVRLSLLYCLAVQIRNLWWVQKCFLYRIIFI